MDRDQRGLARDSPAWLELVQCRRAGLVQLEGKGAVEGRLGVAAVLQHLSSGSPQGAIRESSGSPQGAIRESSANAPGESSRASLTEVLTSSAQWPARLPSALEGDSHVARVVLLVLSALMSALEEW